MHPAPLSTPIRPIRTSRRTTTASRSCRTCSSTTIARTSSATRRAEELPGEVQLEAALHAARRWTTSTGTMFENYRRVLPAQEGRQAGRQAARRRFLRHRLSGRQGLRLLVDADQRLHLAVWRRHLGRDQGARTAMPKASSTRRTAVKALEHYLSPDRIHAAGGQDRHDGHLQVRRAVPRRQGGHEPRLDRLCRSSINPKTSKVADKLVFGQMPGLKGADGKMIRWSNIGGQPFVLTTWNTDRRSRKPSIS